jgi:hypothetical protein
MAKQNRSILKQYFEDGDTPSSAEFGELIDSQVNLEDTGEQIVKGTLSASIIGADAFQLKGFAFEQVTTSQITLTGSNTFGSSSMGASPIITSHSFFGPIYQESSGADSASYFSTPVNFGTTESPIKEGGIFIKKSINLNNAGQNQLSQSISASLLISGADSHLAFDNNEITQYGIGNNLTLKSYSTLAESGGEINFETGDSNTPSNERVSIKTVRLPQTNSNSGYSNHDYGNLNVNDILSVNDTPLLHLVNNNTTRGPFNPIVAALQNSGKCLNLDTDFWDGVNNVYLYSNANNTTTTLERMLWTPESASAFNSTWGEKTQTIASPDTVYYKGWSSSSIKDEVSSSEASAEYFKTQNDYSLGVPNSSGYVLKIKYDGTANDANDVFPGLGGFYQYYPNPQLGGVLNQMNHTYVQVFKALLPATHEFRANENSQGNNNTTYWLTSNKGTGKWEWYARVNHVGDEHQIDNTTGHLGSPISSAGHIYITNNDQSSPTYGSPVTCYLASCTVYDMTEADALTHRRIGIGTINPAAALHVVTSTTIGSSANPTAQSTSSAILISNDFSSDNTARQHLAIDNNEIHQFGNDLHITSQGSNGATGEGNIKFRTATNSDGTPLSDTSTRLYISASGNVGIGTTTPGQTLEVIGHISASGTIYADAINGVINPVGGLKLNDNEFLKIGTGDDLKLYHNATNSWILNETGDLNIRNEANDGDIIFSCDDNAGNTTNYYVIDGGDRKNMFYQPVEISGTTLTVGNTLTVGGVTNITDDTDASNFTGTSGALRTLGGASIAKKLYVGTDLYVDGTSNLDTTDIDGTLNVSDTATFQSHIELGDSDAIKLGAGADLTLQHNGSNTYISNNHVGDFYISNYVDDKDLIFRSDNGSGGIAEYFKLDGSETTVAFAKPIDITNTTDATSDDGDNGALRCEGGASIAKKLYVGGTIYQDTTPIISPNVTTTIFPHQGYMGGGTTQIYAVVGDTTHHMSGQITLKTQNPKLLITIQLAMGDDNGGVNKVHIKPQHFGRDIQGNWNGGWNSGSYTNSNEWLYGGIASNSDNDGELYNISLNNFLYPMFVDNPSGDGFGPGDTVSIGVFINSEKDIYVNRGDSTSTHFYGNANSYITIQEIPQPGG